MNLGAREIIWLLIAALAVYVVFQLLRAASARRAQAVSPAEQETEVAPATAASGASGEAAGPAAADSRAADDDSAPAQRDEVRERAERMALELEVQQLRRDIGQLRAEQDKQRSECERLADEVARMQEATATLQAGQRISPQYGEAVMLARRGMESDAIAERCGISVAEAALVRSLSQGGHKGGDEHGA